MRRFFKALAWLLLGLAALAAMAFAWIVAVNWQDEPLSDAARQALRYTPPAERQLQGNGHLIVAGLDAPATGADAVADAIDLGRRRLAREIERWRWVSAHGLVADGIPPAVAVADPNADAALPHALRCPAAEADCFAWWGRRSDDLRQLLRTQAHLPARYAAAADAAQFSDLFPAYASSQFPPFDWLVRVHELLLANAALQWLDGQPAEALATARQAERARRRLADDSQNLITAMVALAMQVRELRWLSNAVARTTPQTPPAVLAQVDALLAVRPPSLRQALAGEARLTVGMLALARDAPGAGMVPTGWRAQWDKLTNIGFLPMATVNLAAENLRQVQALSDVPADRIEQALASHAHRWAEDGASCAKPWRRNFAGRCLAAMATPSYQGYFQRVHDVEGHRRLVILQRRAQAEGVPASRMAAWLAASPPDLRNPYTLQPMQWDSATGSLVFEGRERQTQNAGNSSTYRIALP